MTNCTNCALQQGYKPAEAVHQIAEPLRLQNLEECRVMNLETIARLDRLNDQQAARIAALEAELAALKAAPGLERDVAEMARLLQNREWADHCTTTELGRRLECAITALYNAQAAPAAQAVEKVLAEWKRQKGLFPILGKDGWMDLALSELAALRATPPAPAAMVDAISDYLEAQDNLDNHEHQSINGESFFTLQRRRNYARDALDAELAAPQAQDVQRDAPACPVLNDAWKERLLDGAPLERDKYGCGHHPALPDFDEGVCGSKFFAVFGIELAARMAESEMDSDAYDAMTEDGLSEDGPNYNVWQPARPDGDGWQLVAIFDTEDGPACWWVRAAIAASAKGGA